MILAIDLALIIVLCVILGAIFLVGLMLVIFYITTKNKFIRLEEDITNSASRIDVYLTKRFDAITKLVDTIKGYTKHEEGVLVEVVKMRQAISDTKNFNDKAKISDELSKRMNDVYAVVENYPKLKADKLFISLQDEIKDIEENLQAARSNYNLNVSQFNKAIKTFPNSLVAKSHFKPYPYFGAEDSKKSDVKISF